MAASTAIEDKAQPITVQKFDQPTSLDHRFLSRWSMIVAIALAIHIWLYDGIQTVLDTRFTQLTVRQLGSIAFDNGLYLLLEIGVGFRWAFSKNVNYRAWGKKEWPIFAFISFVLTR